MNRQRPAIKVVKNDINGDDRQSPVQGGGDANVKEAGANDRERSVKAISVEQEGEEDGKGESARCSSREAEGIGTRASLVKISRRQNDSRCRGKSHPGSSEKAEGEEEGLEAGHEGGEGHPGEGEEAAAEAHPPAVEPLAES